MNVQKLAGGSIQVLLFSGSVFALMLIMSIVLQSPVRRTTLADLFILEAVIAMLFACAWMLRKLWIWSGTIASLLIAKELVSVPKTIPIKSKEEERA